MLTTAPEVRTAIVERYRDARDALGALLKGTPGYRLTGAFASAEEASRQLYLHSPDVLLLCLDDQRCAAQRIRELKDRYPAVCILVLASTASREEIFAVISAGASGYLLRGTPPARLLYAIRELRDGGAPMSPSVARVLVESLHEGSKEVGTARLTRREHDLLQLLAADHSYKTAAVALGVSIDTVRFHVRNVYEKLHVHSKIAAVLKATRDGLVP